MSSSTGSRGGTQAGEAAQGASTSRVVRGRKGTRRARESISPQLKVWGSRTLMDSTQKLTKKTENMAYLGIGKENRWANAGKGRRKKAH